jgi:hypothetical protein
MKKEKIYHIYAKKECIYNNLTEEQFNSIWKTLRGMVGLMKTDYVRDDLSYEMCEVNRISTIDTSN